MKTQQGTIDGSNLHYMNGELILPIILGLLYTGALIVAFLKRDWRVPGKWLIWGHAIFLVSTAILIILFLTTGRTFRGIYSERIIFWCLLITGAFGFSLCRTKNWWTRIYFGSYLLYPIVAATTFFIDRIGFVVIASPIIASLILPETYYKDNRFEIRDNIGIMAPHLLILIEKDWLTEKDIGQNGYENEDSEHPHAIKRVEIINATSDSVNTKLHYENESQLVTFRTTR